jgi:hypothetical protein
MGNLKDLVLAKILIRGAPIVASLVGVMAFITLFAQQDQTRDKTDLAQKVGKLIELLDDDPRVRIGAYKKLEGLGWKHPGRVTKMLEDELAKTESLEVRRRIKDLLDVFEKGRWDEGLLPEAPTKGRYRYTDIWTSKRMIIWSGTSLGKYFSDGAIYQPWHMKK